MREFHLTFSLGGGWVLTQVSVVGPLALLVARGAGGREWRARIDLQKLALLDAAKFPEGSLMNERDLVAGLATNLAA